MITASLTVGDGTTSGKLKLYDSTNYSVGEPITAFSQRVVYLYKSDGSIYKPSGFTYIGDAIDWSDDLDTGGKTLNITGLESDIAIKAVMELTPSGSPVGGSIYSTTSYGITTNLTAGYYYNRMKSVALKQRLESDRSYMQDTYDILGYLLSAQWFIAETDIYTAQLCLDKAAKIESYKLKPY